MIRITSLGSVRVFGDASAELPLAGQQAKRLALLAYLAAARPYGPHRRDTLVALLWPELDQERARAALRQALYGLRKSLGADALLSDGTESVSLNARAVACDLWDLNAAAAAGDHARVVGLYTGDVFQGLFLSDAPEFDQWLDRERARVRAQVRDSSWSLADEAARGARRSDAARFARLALSLAEFDESALRRGMRLLGEIAERSAALAEYERFASALKRELETEPAGETRALAAELRRSAPLPLAIEPIIERPMVDEQRTKTARTPWRRRRYVFAAGMALVAVVAAARMAPSASATLDPRRVRVVSFVSGVNDPVLDTVARAAAASSRDALVQLDNVQIVANADDPLNRAGTEVRGDVRAVDDSIELRAEIVDRSSGAVVRTVASRVARDARGPTLAAFADRVSAAVATALYPGWGTALSQPPSYAGYRLFLDGMRSIKLEQHEAATASLRRAFAEDSTFTAAGLLAAAELYQMSRFVAAESIVTRIAPRRALLPVVDGHLLDWVTRSLAGDRIGARAAMAAIVTIAPSAELAWLQLAIDNVETARPREALAALDHVSETADLTEGWASVSATRAEAFHLLGDHKRELATAREGMRRHPELRVLLSYELRALAALGRLTELDAAMRSLGDGPSVGKTDAPQIMRSVALELAAHGYSDASTALLRRTRSLYEARPATERATLEHRLGLARTLYLADDVASARAIYDSVLVEHPKCLDCVGAIGVLAARAGDAATADTSAARLAASTRAFLFGRHLMWSARIAAARGDRVLAASRLNSAFAAGAEFDVLTHADPDLAAIKPDSIYRVFARTK